MEIQAAALPIMPVSTSATTSLQKTTPDPPTSTTTKPATTSNATSTVTHLTDTIMNDPYSSWIFFPEFATYTPPVYHPSTGATPSSPPATPSSPPRSPRSSPPPPSSQSKSQSSSSTTASTTTAPSSAPSTHHRILDHCFYVSIDTRLKQAEAQYQAARQEQAAEQQASNGVKHEDWRKRQKSLVDEAVVLSRKGSNVEAIVDGILKSHRSNGPLQTLPRHLKIRLHLCQLTSMVFGRFDVASSTNSAGLNVYSAFHSRRHGVARAAIKQRFATSERGQQIQSLFTQPIPASIYCRRHHRKDCKRTCCTLAKLQQEQQQALEVKKKLANSYFMNTVRKQEHQRVAGLVDAIPAFLKASAMSYRDIVNNAKAEKAKEMEAKKAKDDKVDDSSENDLKQEIEDAAENEQEKEKEKVKVLEGWYKLLLELMTQAVIEAYLCDETTGFDTILDVFSYGDDPNKEEEEVVMKDIVMEDVTVATSPSSNVGVEGLQFQSLSGLGSTTMSKVHHAGTTQLHDVTTKDRQDDILFAKTPEYISFKTAKDERLQEFLTLAGETMEHHFAEMAEKYPLIVFERQMTHFIARAQELLVDPKLSQNSEKMGLLIPPTTSAYADGSLSMPVSEDEDDEDDETGSRLEEIIEEDEEDNSTLVIKKEKQDTNETIDEQKRRLERSSTPLAAIKQENSNDIQDISTEMEQDDDDNSTAARVVQVSKKHKHQNDSGHSQETSTDSSAPLAKKTKLSP
ncbi:hypothetical protein FBU30_009293 [Linnemannia zychae]|nr:hypothetical protein FBU30_009293 [Linnemannia zychae]